MKLIFIYLFMCHFCNTSIANITGYSGQVKSLLVFFVNASVPAAPAPLINSPCKLKKISESANSYHNNFMFISAFSWYGDLWGSMGLHGEIFRLSTLTGLSVSIHTLAPQLRGLSGEYMTLLGPSISTVCPYVLLFDVLHVITGFLSPVLLFLFITCILMCIRFFISEKVLQCSLRSVATIH